MFLYERKEELSKLLRGKHVLLNKLELKAKADVATDYKMTLGDDKFQHDQPQAGNYTKKKDVIHNQL